jgi:cytochrome P450
LAPGTVCPVSSPTDPYADYAGLREAGPVHRISGTDGNPAWLVTRYDDVRRALADPRLSLDKRNGLPGNYRGLALPPALDANLLNLDPPDHTRIRKLVTQAFTSRRVEALRAPIRSTADALLDAMIPRGRADLVAEYAAPLPITVICDLLGVPAEGRTDFRRWTDALLVPPSPEAAREAIGALLKFFAELIADKRAAPADDLVSDMIAARDEGDSLSDDELTSLVFLILFAGYENVVHQIGNSVLALLDNPAQYDELRADRSLLPAAVEEFLRYDGPAPLAIRRFALEDVSIGGVVIPAGETVLLGVASANRDSARFPNADRLAFDRAVGGHLTLGHGIHYCLGAPLARIEIAIAIEALLDRVPGLALAVPRNSIEWRKSPRTRGVVALPITF